MDKNLIEELLYEDESPTLDFKQEQYLFEKASDDQKGELLKDILAFANAWRRTEAYILIGVKEIKGGKSEIKGVAHHLDEASLQQFVNSKTNRPVNFSYQALVYEGEQIGIIRIPVQERPIFPKKDFGKLPKGTVYIRRGSSTDCADPDEIAKMGAALVALGQVPTVDLQFAEVESRTVIGKNLTLQSEVLALPDKSLIPEAGSNRGYLVSITDMVNSNYYREFADYLFYTSLLKPVGFIFRNTGTTVAINTRAQIVQSKLEGLLILDSSDYPSQPQYSDLSSLSGLNGLRGILANGDSVTSVDDRKDSWEVSVKVGNVQPKAEAWSEIFYIGAVRSCNLDLKVSSQ